MWLRVIMFFQWDKEVNFINNKNNYNLRVGHSTSSDIRIMLLVENHIYKARKQFRLRQEMCVDEDKHSRAPINTKWIDTIHTNSTSNIDIFRYLQLTVICLSILSTFSSQMCLTAWRFGHWLIAASKVTCQFSDVIIHYIDKFNMNSVSHNQYNKQTDPAT